METWTHTFGSQPSKAPSASASPPVAAVFPWLSRYSLHQRPTSPGEQRVHDKFIYGDLTTTAATSAWGCHHHQLTTVERALLGVLHLSSLGIHTHC